MIKNEEEKRKEEDRRAEITRYNIIMRKKGLGSQSQSVCVERAVTLKRPGTFFRDSPTMRSSQARGRNLVH